MPEWISWYFIFWEDRVYWGKFRRDPEEKFNEFLAVDKGKEVLREAV